jgi:hypothetical protein
MTLRADLDGVGNVYRLCFVRASWAYFTRIGLDGQWGEGWDKAPYQFHAHLPYGDGTDQILKVAFDGPLFHPIAGLNGHSLSALELNAGARPGCAPKAIFTGRRSTSWQASRCRDSRNWSNWRAAPFLRRLAGASCPKHPLPFPTWRRDSVVARRVIADADQESAIRPPPSAA